MAFDSILKAGLFQGRTVIVTAAQGGAINHAAD
ncbi:hypothetical protein M2397_002677 [Pseudomonas sp. BIGb0381]|nr:hypothetical protein [Pseudomonas sp. BIGb0381]